MAQIAAILHTTHLIHIFNHIRYGKSVRYAAGKLQYLIVLIYVLTLIS
jgi:hypothetical protein